MMGRGIISRTMLLVVCLSLVMISCNSPNQTSVVSPVPKNSTEFIATPTIIHITTPTPALAITTLPTSPLPPSVTPTPLSTLSPEKAQALVLDLLRDNGGCRLPCWWGLTPGKTSWTTALGFLETFATSVYLSASPQDQPLYHASFRFSVPTEISSISEVRVRLTIRDDVIETILFSDFEWPIYRPGQFLNDYKMPSEVWISTYSTKYNDSLPFVVVLFYPEQGIMATYSTEGEIQGDTVQGCLQHSPSLRLWSPEQGASFHEVAKKFNWDVESVPYLPLASVTQMNVELFYQTSIATKTTLCLTTPAKLWPKP